ncbi:Hypothetical protein A7982_03591 [Minicystis rosea]|nr:Hypothetical protein A7982_03591 [Minicystis rosea]
MRALFVPFGLALAALTSCALDSSGLGAATSTETTGSSMSSGDPSSSSSATGTSSSGSTATSSGGGQGGGAPVGDALPLGAVSFFETAACPTGWDAYTAADGMTILPAVDPASSGTPHGTPLAPGEDRVHTHGIDTFFALASFQLAGFGGGNDSIAAAGQVTFQTTADAKSTGLPYVRFLVCKKSAKPIAGTLPTGMHMFYEGPSCPSGWQQPSGIAGRFMVALPAGAAADQTFGGEPLTSKETRTHKHSFSALLQTDQESVVLASGCCNDGFAKNDAYTTVDNMAESEPAVPYLELLQCVKM